jgi:hypothetical protein
MSAQIIPFPPAERAEELPHPYDFWMDFLNDLTPERRRDAIQVARRVGLIDDRDVEILETTPWSDGGGRAA